MRYGKTIGTGEAMSVLKAENAEMLERIKNLEEWARLAKIHGLPFHDWNENRAQACKDRQA